MKTYKLLLLVLVLGVLSSCSNESVETPNDTLISFEAYDTSSLGRYTGLFTTDEGLTRGSLFLELLPNVPGVAQLTLSTGELITLKSAAVTATDDQAISQLRFTSLESAAMVVSFDFSVASDGTNPMTSDVVFDAKPSNILIAKNTQRIPLTPITGTYACSNCGSIGQGFPTRGLTWNVMAIGAGNNQTFMTQVAYGGRVYTSAAENNAQTNCAQAGDFTTCDINGSIRILGQDVTWGGTHTYSTTTNQTACSAVSGSWSAPTWGAGATGTFVSDADCSSTMVVNDTCDNAVLLAIGDSVTGSTVNATNIDAPSFVCVTNFDTAPGVWYTFVGNGFPVSINTEGSALDTKLGLFLGSCGALICEDGDDNGGTGNTSLIPKNTNLNEVYYIYVTGAGTSTGDFILNIAGPTSTTTATCDESIQDHAGNGSYSGNRTDAYTIDAGVGNTVNLYFSEFDTEEGYDFLIIYDGSDTGSPEVTMSVEGTPADAEGFSGTGTGINSLFQQNVVSTGRYLTLVFTSDNNVVGTGFTADITCVSGRHAMGLQKTSLTLKPNKRIMPKK